MVKVHVDGRWGVALAALLACAPAPRTEDAGPGPDVFDPASLDDAHVVGVLAFGDAADCSTRPWCASGRDYERLDITALEDWIGEDTAPHLLLPQRASSTLRSLFGAGVRVLYAGRVAAPDDPASYGSTCGMPPEESFTYPVDATSIWVLDDDGSRAWELQCVLAVADTLDGDGRDPSGRTLSDALLARPGCHGTRARARAQASESLARVPARAASVVGENRCRRLPSGADAGRLLP